jgi:hypothetical protein
MIKSMDRSARLTVKIEGTSNPRIPVQIADSTLLVLRTVMSGEGANLPSGRYVVSADLPGTGRLSRVVDITDEDQSIALAPPVDSRETRRHPSWIATLGVMLALAVLSVTATAVSPPSGVDPPPLWVVLGVSLVLMAGLVFIAGVGLYFVQSRRAIVRSVPSDWSGSRRTVDGITPTSSGFAVPWRNRWAEPLARRSTYRDGVLYQESVGLSLSVMDHTSKRARIACHVTSPTAIIAEFAVQGLTPVMLVVPAFGSSRSDRCTISLTASRHDLEANVTFVSPDLAALAAYVEAGDIRGAAAIASALPRTFRDKSRDPVFASLCAYVLLRRNEQKALGVWTDVLAEGTEALPDAAIISGEHWARQGKHNKAVRQFLVAMDRGLPLFADGFSLLASRLRRYLQYEPSEMPYDRAFRGCIRDAETRYLALAPRVSATSAVLTLRGAGFDLTHSKAADQEPHEGTHGWHRVRAKDSSDPTDGTDEEERDDRAGSDRAGD